MKICVISDTHEKHKYLHIPQDVDVLVHCGDWTLVGEEDACYGFVEWFSNSHAPCKILIAGNHELSLDSSRLDHKASVKWKLLRRMEELGITYLEDSSVVMGGVKFYGSPYQPEFCAWGFNLYPDQLEPKWAQIPNDTDVLITHGPPRRILDVARPGGFNLGCQALFNRVMEVSPKLHCFGHIHGGYGQKKFMDTHFVNGASCDERYQLVNEPIVVEL